MPACIGEGDPRRSLQRKGLERSALNFVTLMCRSGERIRT
jgi:hypothetical protein